MKFLQILVFASSCLAFHPLQAAPLINSWTYAGGGLNPTTYGVGAAGYMPTTLIPDTANSNGAVINLTGLTSGGLGSSSYPAYGGLYTLFSVPVNFNLNTSTVLTGVQTISLTFTAGGGSPTALNFDADDVVLNFNLANPNLTNASFSKGAPFLVSTPIGNQSVSVYTWIWDVSSLGPSSGISLLWGTSASSEHAFFTDIFLTQAIPEPSSLGLVAIAAGLLFGARKRFRK